VGPNQASTVGPNGASILTKTLKTTLMAPHSCARGWPKTASSLIPIQTCVMDAKSASRRFDGHKCDVLTDENSELVLGVDIRAGNAGDGEGATPLVEQVQQVEGVSVEGGCPAWRGISVKSSVLVAS
jgi:hypothetical protein